LDIFTNTTSSVERVRRTMLTLRGVAEMGLLVGAAIALFVLAAVVL
jgi:hypothetical protein